LLLASCDGGAANADGGDFDGGAAGVLGGAGLGGTGLGGAGNAGTGGAGAGGASGAAAGSAGNAGSAGGGGMSLGGSGGDVGPIEPGVTLCRVELSCDLEIQDEPKTDCGLRIATGEGGEIYASRAGLERRGRSSQAYEKPNYSVELRDAAGAEQPTNLLGMGSESDWILDGSWIDRSFVRNELAFAMFRGMGEGRWAPEGRYCELSLNGEARGIYRLGERIKRDDDRLDIPEDTGDGQSFVVKQDSEGALYWAVGEASSWKLVSPDEARSTDAQRQGVQAFLDQLDQALQSRDEQASFALLDLDAIVDFVIVQELAKSADAYNLSLHLWKAPGAPAQLVPWDFDLSMGQPNSLIRPGTELASGWVPHRTLLTDGIDRQPIFQARLAQRWQMHREGALADAAMLAVIDRALETLEPDAIAANFARWPLEDVDFVQIFPAYSLYRVGSYAEEIERLRGWLIERAAWIDAHISAYPD
jgi:hypothetical protein